MLPSSTPALGRFINPKIILPVCGSRGAGQFWHQAVSPDFQVRFARLLPKKIAVNLLIAVFKEYRFSTIATLRHVVRETGYHHAGQTRHEHKLNRNQNSGE